MAKPPREQEPEEMVDESLSSARSILERVTGEKMPNRVRRERATKGASARSANLTPERRKEIAVKAASTRWQK
jgi:hypothetical protein